MAKKYMKRTSHRRRCKKGGSHPLGSATYPGSKDGSWTTSAPQGSIAALASSYKPQTSNQYMGGTPAQNAGAANEYALKGPGPTTHSVQGGGGRSKRRGRGRKHSKKSSNKIFPKSFGTESSSREQQMAQGMSQGQAQAQAAAMQQAQSQQQAQTQSGGMFASFGALLKEALVPLGLLAAQQTYGKSYGKRTRKHRR
jgi:hypothetical protein